MKKIFVIIILLLTAVLVFDSIKYIKDYNKSVEISKTYQQQGYNVTTPLKMDVFTKLSDYYMNGTTIIIQFIYPLLLIIVGTYEFHNKFHSGFFKNIIMREKYKYYLKKEVLKAWKGSLLIPVFILIAFICACLVTNFNFNLNSYTIHSMFSSVTSKTIFTEVTNLILMTLNLVIVSIACINIGLIFSKKNSNFIVSCVISYLVIIVYEIIAEIIVGSFLYKISNSDFFANGLTLFSFWYYSTGVTALNIFIYGILLVFVTSFILKKTFSNKEEVIIDAEK